MSNKIISFRDCYKIVNPTEEQWKTFKDSASLNGKRRLRTYFEATHSAISNKNERAYLPSMMRIGADSFTKGKRAPILKHHNPDADPVGKVVSAQYIDTVPQDLVGDPNVLALIDQATPIKKQVRAMASFLRSKAVLADGWRGLGYVKVGADIIDPTTIEQMESGLFDAVSVGFGSDHAFCSICFADWLDPEDGMCSHIPGKTYKDEDTEVERKANLIPGNMFFKELSLVNFDADPFTTVEVEGFAYDSVKEEDPVHKEIFPTQMIWEVRDSEEATGMIIEIKDGAPIELNDDESKVFEVIKEARPEAEDSVLADFAKKIMALKQEDGKYLGQDEAEIDEKTYIVYALEDFETQGQTIDAEEVYAQMEVELAAMAKDGILSEEILKDAKLSSEQRNKLGEKTFCGPGRSFPVADCAHVTAARRLIGRYKGPGNKTSILACVARKAKALGCSSGSSDSAPNTQPDPIAPATDSVKQPKDLTDDELRALFADVETTMIERKLTVKRECSECVSSLKAATEAKEAEDKAKKELISSQDTVSVLRDELRHEFSSHKILIDECVTIGQELRRVKTEYAALLSLATGKQDSLDKAKAEFTDSKDFDIIYKTFVDSVDFGKIIDKMTSGIAREPEGMVDDPTIKTDKDNDQKVSLSKTDFELVNRMREFLQDKEDNRAALLFDRMRRNGVLGEQITWDMIVSQTKITCE